MSATSHRPPLPRAALVLLVTVVLLAGGLAATSSMGAAVARSAAPSCGQNTDLSGLVGHAHPVILVHGWTGGPMSGTRTMFEGLPSSNGRQYLLFDYARASTQWPDSPDIAACLATYIKTVSDTNRERGGDGMVYLVAHSMGGLAIRFALDPAYGGVDGLADDVGGVVTLDTPYQGSLWGDSFFSWAKSAWNDTVGQHMFPSADARAWHCLSGGPRETFPADCASPPPLPEQIPLFQIGGDVTLQRTLFGFSAYAIDLGGDGIVDETSEWGSRGADGGVVATQSGTATVGCSVDLGDLADQGPVSFFADIGSDNWLIDLYQGRYSPDNVRVLATLTSLITVLFSAPCSHPKITVDPEAVSDADAQLGDMIRRQAGISKVSDLAGAPVPASCRHPAGRLHGFSRNWGKNSDGSDAGETWLETKLAVFGDVTGDGRSDAVVPMQCTAGGVTWPETLLVYGPGTRLEGTYDMAGIKDPGEHVDATSLTLRDGGADVAFSSYEGAGFGIATYRGRLTAPGGKVVFTYDGPLTVDYATGRDFPGADNSIGEGIVTSQGDAKLWLDPAPADFEQFIRGRWLKLSSSGCPYTPTVSVDRYSHLGYASGEEGACGGAEYLWHRTSSGWKVLLGYQEGPFCNDLDGTPDLRRALTVLGLKCFSQNSAATQTLGHWPTSGE